MQVWIDREKFPDAKMPAKNRDDDAGYDIASVEEYTLAPGERHLFETGVRVDIAPHHAAFINPRSGLAHKHGVTIVNAPGTVDVGYHGTIRVNLINQDPTTPHTIKVGDRIGQIILQQVCNRDGDVVEVASRDEFRDSERGEAGHGSTGA